MQIFVTKQDEIRFGHVRMARFRKTLNPLITRSIVLTLAGALAWIVLGR